ncbi:Ig-like domain-containing protein, partial [Clostridium tertium]|uniref:Ig-like domain-containing protein n=1 Tax=Clostridium tertium TaxID=1559 RepID=UPI0024B328D3
YQESEYTLPESVTTVINGESLSIPLTWNVATVDTSSAGTFTYYGTNEEYGRQVEFTLTVLENVYDKQAGSIKNAYSANGKTYIDVDLVELYVGFEEAVKEAVKDNRAAVNENGEYFLPNSYYIRNNYTKLTTYEVSNNCTFQLLDYDLIYLGYDVTPKNNSSIPEAVSLETFKNYIDNPISKGRSVMCWIELKNDVAYSIYRQHTP